MRLFTLALVWLGFVLALPILVALAILLIALIQSYGGPGILMTLFALGMGTFWFFVMDGPDLAWDLEWWIEKKVQSAKRRFARSRHQEGERASDGSDRGSGGGIRRDLDGLGARRFR